MSRIGKLPIQLPDKVKVAVEGNLVKVEGPKGKNEHRLAPGITVKAEGKTVVVNRPNNTREARMLHGRVRSTLNNMVKGVAQGWERALEISGVGFKAEVQGDKINFALGYTHPILFPLPKGVTAEFDQKTNRITLRGVDKQVVG